MNKNIIIVHPALEEAIFWTAEIEMATIFSETKTLPGQKTSHATMRPDITLGSCLSDGGCAFGVWAPFAKRAELMIMDGRAQVHALSPCGGGTFSAFVEGAGEGTRYCFSLNGGKGLPDPASRFQPEGVHGPSCVVDPGSFRWGDAGWRGLELKDYIIYELHTGTFTSGGTFEAVIPMIGYLRDELGINAVELMPVGQFPGGRNWGYDGVCFYAPQSTYGGPRGLKTLVNALHSAGMAAILDVVYNHAGPEGNYLGQFGPYFSNRYRTPWGPAFNYDGADSDWVRRFVVENALYWISEFHFDALRLDAVHGIYDSSAKHILEEISEGVSARARRDGRRAFLIAESDLNDPRLVRGRGEHGYGMDAQWLDDFHHSLHPLVTKERDGYYSDFGALRHLNDAYNRGFVYRGQYSGFRRRHFGRPSDDLGCDRFIVFSQNHDQVGNRAMGDRLCATLPPEAQRLAAAATLLSPYMPMLFMGEEYSEVAPFQFFVSHSDPALIESVRKGRREEFRKFNWGEVPDPQDPRTFERCKIDPRRRFSAPHACTFRWYRDLIALRKRSPSLGVVARKDAASEVLQGDALALRKRTGRQSSVVIMSFSPVKRDVVLALTEGEWTRAICSNRKEYGGNGEAQGPPSFVGKGECTLALQPYGTVVYIREKA